MKEGGTLRIKICLQKYNVYNLFIATIFCLVFLFSLKCNVLLATSKEESVSKDEKSYKPKNNSNSKILCSVFPIYAITKALLVNIDNVECNLQFKNFSGCVHSYFLTPKELAEIQSYNIFIMLGEGFESFYDDLLVRNLLSNNEVNLIKVGTNYKYKNLSFDKNQHLFTIPDGYLWITEKIYNVFQKIFIKDVNILNILNNNYAKMLTSLNEINKMYTDAKDKLKKPKVILAAPIFEYIAVNLDMEIIDTIQNEQEHIHNHYSLTVSRIRELIEKIKMNNVNFIIASKATSDMTIINMLNQDTNVKIINLSDFLDYREVPTSYLENGEKLFIYIVEKLKDNLNTIIEEVSIK